MERSQSTSLRQLPPVSRYYIRRLLQHTIESLTAQQNDPESTTILRIRSLGQSNDEIDQSIETLLNQEGQGQVKAAELERLALLFQELGNQGTTFRAQMMSMLETKVADLMGLTLETPIAVPSASSVVGAAAPVAPPIASPTVLAPLARISPEPSAAPRPPAQSHPESPFETVVVSIPTPAPPVMRQPETIYEYLTMFNAMSRISRKYLGAAVTVKNWESCRPEADWLSQIQLSEQAEFCTIGADSHITPNQHALLEHWGVGFINHSSRIINNFSSLLRSLGIALATKCDD
jgi:hypothetical protein